MTATVLCAVTDITDPGSKGPFTVETADGPRAVFLVRHGDTIRGWLDSCPHVLAPLEMEEDRFLDLTGGYILCAMHGAHFDPISGECVMGPCPGRRLTRWEIRIEDGMVVTP